MFSLEIFLDCMDEESLINLIKNDIDVKKNLSQLIERHEGMFYKVLHGYIKSDVNGLTKQDIINQKLTIFWEAVSTFDPNRGVKFVTWLGNFTFFFISKEYNKVKESKNSVEIIDNLLFSNDSFFNKIEKIDLILEEIQNIEDDRIIEIFHMRYFNTTNHKLKTWQEIGEKLNLSGQACLNLHNKGVDYLKSKIKND